MHNLHLVVVKAENGQDACSIVETEISRWGDENNWRTICGAVSEDDEVYQAEEGRFEPGESYDTIAKINKMVKGWLKGSFYGETAKRLLDKGKKIERFSSQEAWSLMRYAEYIMELKHIKERKKFRKAKGQDVKSSFDVLTDSFYEWKLDENGVTQLDVDGDGKLWVVFVDMHS